MPEPQKTVLTTKFPFFERWPRHRSFFLAVPGPAD